MAKCATTILAFLLSITLLAQEFPIQKLGVEEGLGHSITYRTFQSSNGYIWFSTDNGLTRFDGVYFRNFTTQDGLASNFIFDVEEVDSVLLISTFGGGLMTFNGNTFRRYNADSSVLKYPITIDFFQDEIMVNDRYKQLHRGRGGDFKPITASEMGVFDDNFIETYSVACNDTVMFIASSSGLFSYDGKTFTRLRQPPFVGTNIYNVRFLRNGKLLVSNKSHLLEVDPGTGESRELFQSDYFSPQTTLLEDHEGNIWIALINGDTYLLKSIDKGGPREIIKVFSGTVINQFFEDRERNMWVATYGEGAWCIRSIHVRNYPIRGAILSDVAVDTARRQVTVATANAGLRIYQQTEGGFLTPVENDLRVRALRDKKNIVAAAYISPRLSLFSSDQMLYKWNGVKLDSVEVPSLISVFHYEKKKDRLWVGCRFGLLYYESDGTLRWVEHMKQRLVKSISEDHSGKILVGTDNGLYIGTDSDFRPVPAEDRLQNAYINAIHTDPSGVTWVATGTGLGRIRGARLEAIDYPLAKMRCNSIAGDSKGRMWIGTVRGLLYYDNGQFSLVTTREGIAQSNITKVIYQESIDLLNVLTSNGISVLDSRNFIADSKFQLPEIIIEQALSGLSTLDPSASVYELPTTHRDLKVTFATPMIKNRDKIVFSYRLNDDAWTEFNGRELSLKSLPYGDIVLTVRAQELYRSGTEKILPMRIFVPRPFFLRWYFMLLMIAVLSASIAAVVFAYSKKKTRKLLEENKRLDVEHKALRNLLNPHFLYNAINSIHAFVLENDQRKTLAYLSKFSQLVRLNLELLSADRVTLEKEIKNIGLYLEFEKLRFANKLNYSIEIDTNVIQEEIHLPSFLIQPFLENAIWHGLLPREQGGKLMLRVDRVKDKLIITIDDDGVGINTSLMYPKPDIDKKTSMGINITRERIELLKKFNSGYGLSIIDKAELNGKATNTGTVVRITIPL